MDKIKNSLSSEMLFSLLIEEGKSIEKIISSGEHHDIVLFRINESIKRMKKYYTILNEKNDNMEKTEGETEIKPQ